MKEYVKPIVETIDYLSYDVIMTDTEIGGDEGDIDTSVGGGYNPFG